jgi:hypothetical protein
MNSFIKFLFISFFLFIFFLATILLKPMNLHIKRTYSTLSLKVTYLLYLASFLFFTYLFLFFNGRALFYLEDPDDPRAMLHFSLLLLAFFIPNTGILIRRKIKKRTIFNVIMSIVNLIFGTYLWFLIDKTLS